MTLVGATARAQEKARLVYVRGAGAENCPAEVNLRLLIIARLGYDPFSPQASRLVLSRVELNGPDLVGSLEVVDQGGISSGRRELTSGRCDELARALALSISLAIDPERASQPSPNTPPTKSEAAPTAATEPPPAAAPVERAPPAKGDARSASNHAFAGFALSASTGTLPAPAFGAVASVGVRSGALSLSLEGLAEQSSSTDVTPRGRLSGTLFGAGVAGCWRTGDLSLCGLGLGGVQRLSSSEVVSPGASSGPFVAVGPRVGWAVPLGARLDFVAALAGLWSFARNNAELSGREVWRAPPVSASLSFGLRASFL